MDRTGRCNNLTFSAAFCETPPPSSGDADSGLDHLWQKKKAELQQQ